MNQSRVQRVAQALLQKYGLCRLMIVRRIIEARMSNKETAAKFWTAVYRELHY